MSSYNSFFCRIYDTVFYPVLNPIRKKIAGEVINLKPNKLIDMCCGTGNQFKYFEELSNSEIIGIDISDNMLAVATQRYPDYIYLKQDATETQFEDNSFDVAILNFILHETIPNNAMRISDEAKRLVRKGGKIIICDYVLDKKTSIIGKIGVYLVEFLIGGQHYKNFKNFYKNKLLQSYVWDLKKDNEFNFCFNAIRIFIYNNHKN